MSKRADLLLEGSYNYFKGDKVYSQENFKFFQNLEAQSFQVNAEILSRIESGEFLKILVKYEMNQSYIPLMVRIEKFLGSHYAQELYKIDPVSHELHYSFQTPKGEQEFKAPFNMKHYLTSPSMATSCLFALSKKMDTLGRTPIILMSSSNDWSYEGPPHEKVLYAEIKNHDLPNFRIDGTELSASHWALYDQDATAAQSSGPVNFYISKHFSIPYQMVHADQKIVIDNLKKHF